MIDIINYILALIGAFGVGLYLTNAFIRKCKPSKGIMVAIACGSIIFLSLFAIFLFVYLLGLLR